MSEPFSNLIDKALFDAASGIELAAVRRAFLASACHGDDSRQARIERWLAAAAEADEFFTGAALAVVDPGGEVAEAITLAAAALAPVPRDAGDGPGARIGRYRLLERIGEGGHGVVHLAEQLEPVTRRVALKVIRLGLDTEQVITRFEMERQALAMMDHPNIAAVLDAGATDSGRPYFVMELVSGVKITTHCDEQRLGLRQRLELFIQVCHAIQHAHQKGIIHRDIKPSNVLVSHHDGLAVPKVIDFGIARATEGRLADHTAITEGNPMLGTPAYMSPEQANGSQDLDTRSDVYSLGVLLAELLTGRTPFDGTRLAKAGVFEMLRILREEEAPAPSALLAGLTPDELATMAAARGVERAKLVAAVRGELDWIALKALAKDRGDRYETVNGLAMDLRRYLADEPVLARAPGRLYLIGKTVRRNKVLFVSTAAVLAALVVGLGTASWLFSRERVARHEAEVARANEARLLGQAKAREAVSLAAMRLAEGKIEEADAMLDKTPLASIEPSLEAAGLFLTLGDWNAIRQRTTMAADCYALFLQANRLDQSPSALNNMMLMMAIGPTLVEAGRVTDYSRFREETITRNENVADLIAISGLLKACLLMPADKALLARMRPQTEKLATVQGMDAYQSAFAALSLAMMAYRSGDFNGALEWRDKCLAYPDSNQARAGTIHAVAAMAAQRLGRTEQARTELAMARAMFVGPFDRDALLPRGKGNGYWLDWAIARVLVREAAGMIDGKGSR
ncbi:MAG: serine/threonine-protein kinase [Luteolibacter sp.]